MLSEVKSVSGTWPRETGKGKHQALEKLTLAFEGAEGSEAPISSNVRQHWKPGGSTWDSGNGRTRRVPRKKGYRAEPRKVVKGGQPRQDVGQ